MLVIEPVEHIYEIFFFLFPLDYILVALVDTYYCYGPYDFELVILICMNGCAYDIFRIMFRNASSPAPIGIELVSEPTSVEIQASLEMSCVLLGPTWYPDFL